MRRVSVHTLNTGSQTFMHVLDPRRMIMSDMLALKKDLELYGFDFCHADVLGQTFAHSMAHYEMHPLDFARCWLTKILRKDPWGGVYIEPAGSVRRIFESCGGTSRQWDMLGWKDSADADGWAERLGFDDLTFSVDLNRRLPASTRCFELRMLTWKDQERRNVFHIVADGLSGSPDPNELRQHCFSRLSVVHDLLDIKCECGCIRSLIKHQDASGETPLMAHISSKPCSGVIVEQLLHHGADPEMRNHKGESALHISIKMGNVAATKALLAHGVNIHARNSQGEGVIAVAERVLRQMKDDVDIWAKITACAALAIDHGAIASPTLFHEWDLPKEIQLRNLDIYHESIFEIRKSEIGI
ncbi:MAG: hypothetical protein Q9221_003373 [Calogaya cf. arnoldii]